MAKGICASFVIVAGIISLVCGGVIDLENKLSDMDEFDYDVPDKNNIIINRQVDEADRNMPDFMLKSMGFHKSVDIQASGKLT